MIQVRYEFDNIYIKILDQYDSFDRDLEKIRTIPQRSYNKSTNEWMAPRSSIVNILKMFSQITWVNSLSEIAEGLPVDHEILKKHLSWESEKEFDFFKCKLYPYQKIGANFLIDKGQGAVFDGCGLGKTPILIAAASKIILEDPSRKALIVTLSSLKKQWEKEVSKFTDFTAIAANGTNQQRMKILNDFQKSNHSFLIVNYEMLRSESYVEILKGISFAVIGLDEAQKIKTGVTDRSLRIKPSQNAKGAYEFRHISYRFLATATPVQGKAEEIFSLFQFLDPDILGDWKSFKQNYCNAHPKYGITGYKNMVDLYEQIQPYFIRRTKNMPEIRQQLPKVQHAHLFLEMDPKQSEVHDYLLDQIDQVKEKARSISGEQFINGASMSEQAQKEYYDQIMQAYQVFLIACCDDTNLFFQSESQLSKKIVRDCSVSTSTASPKLVQLQEFYESMTSVEPESKVVVFTRFERMAKNIHQVLPRSVLFTGKMNSQQREEAVESFRSNPEVKAIIATDAGSTGLNLQVANYMVHFDLPWDPTLIEQRNGRIDRTGSAFENVTVYYYIMSESFDEQLLKIIQRKSELADQLIGGSKQAMTVESNPNLLAIEQMIKHKQKKQFHSK